MTSDISKDIIIKTFKINRIIIIFARINKSKFTNCNKYTFYNTIKSKYKKIVKKWTIR